MIRKQLLISTFITFCVFATAQQITFLKGKITDDNNRPLAGINLNLNKGFVGTSTNSMGEYHFTRIPQGNYEITFSYTGYQTKTVSFTVKKGENILNEKLEKTIYDLEGIVVTAQKREEQIQDVPVSISAISGQTIQSQGIKNLEQFSDLVPGFNARIQSNQRPTFVIRGLSSDEVSPSAQARVSLFFNNMPISRASGGVLELYDMERVEVLKGPQGSLFGRGAQIGAIHFISKMPENKFGGYFSIGGGNFNKKEIETAINIPIVKNKLNTRIAAVYSKQDGYIKNTFGGTLNGKDTKAFRFSTRYLPTENTKIDFIINYQKDDSPGVGFISGQYPNSNGVNDVFAYEASQEQGEELQTTKEVISFILNLRHYFNDNLYLTAISSYQKNDAFERWDGDGTAAPAIDMSETLKANQFSQEVRLNFMIGNKVNGFIGANFLREKVNQSYWFSPNEQYMVHLFLNPNYMIMPDGTPFALPNLPLIPELGPLGGMPLVADHQESNDNQSINTTKELFYDISWSVTPRLKLTGGTRLVFDDVDVSSESQMIGGSPATLGFFTNNYPNIFFKTSPLQNTKAKFSGLTVRLSALYKINNSANIYLSYAKGRRPNVVQYQSNGSSEILSDETVNSYEIGYKTFCTENLLFDFIVFFHKYNNFQTNAWIADPNNGNFAYLIKDGGRATTCGLETSFQYSINKNIKIMGNYAYIKARYDDVDKDGNEQEFANNQFRLTPDHSFSFSIKYQTDLSKTLRLFAVPSFSYKSHYYFEDANTAGIEQNGYGLLNINTGIKLNKMSININIYAHNILNTKYLLSAGNTGSLFGIPTYVPAMPRSYGFNIQYKF